MFFMVVSASAAGDEEEPAQDQEHSHDPFKPNCFVENESPDDELKNVSETDQGEGQAEVEFGKHI
jgi:hypothetical protein